MNDERSGVSALEESRKFIWSASQDALVCAVSISQKYTLDIGPSPPRMPSRIGSLFTKLTAFHRSLQYSCHRRICKDLPGIKYNEVFFKKLSLFAHRKLIALVGGYQKREGIRLSCCERDELLA